MDIKLHDEIYISSDIGYLKYKISEKGHIPEESFNLYFRGLVLENDN